jgi:Zn-dependent protease
MELSLEAIVLWGVPVVLAITLHEAAHGYIAKLFGDRTAEMLGRVTLNPVKHVDPVGTILVPALLVLFKAPFLFGWAKPVPVNFANLRHPKRDMIAVAGAGPASNFVQALAWALALVAALAAGSDGFARMAEIGVRVNLVLMALNLLPIPPLDGGRILVGLLPEPAARIVARIEPWGLFVLVALLFARVLDDLMLPLVRGGFAVIAMLLSTFGVPLPGTRP